MQARLFQKQEAGNSVTSAYFFSLVTTDKPL